MASIARNVLAYEKWLRKRCAVVDADLEAKHERMRKSPFGFLRATYFHWARTIERICPTLATAPSVACVGDIHIENFGTWRDADARLVWGINDFDEVASMPYAYDLVRLTASALLAPALRVAASDVGAAILAGYRSGLAAPRATLLDEHATWLRSFANPTAHGADEFWKEVDSYPDIDPPPKVRKALRKSLPEGAHLLRFAARSKGGGSLGRPRFVAIAEWNSGRVMREAKAWVPSAWYWAHPKAAQRDLMLPMAYGRFRSPDPHLRARAGFVLRRIAPDSRKIEFAEVQVHGLTTRLLHAMAADLAAVHCASAGATRVSRDLEARGPTWLQRNARAAVAATKTAFQAYAALVT